MTTEFDPTPAPSVAAANEAFAKELVNQILAKARPELAEGLRLAAVPVWVDQALLAALRGPGDADGLTPRIFERLCQFNFVAETSDSPPNAPRVRYSADMRAALLATCTPAELQAAHTRAYAALSARAAAADPAQAEALRVDALGHRLALDPAAGLDDLMTAIDDALESYRLAYADRLLALGHDSEPSLPADGPLWLSYQSARLAIERQQTTRAQTTLESLLARSELTPRLLARVQAALARVHVTQEDWTHALWLYNTARTAFQEQQDTVQVAHTELGLGQAHMDLALHVWGQNLPARILQGRARFRPEALAGLIHRLPVLIFLVAMLGRSLLRELFSLARGQDWLIARECVRAARWLRRAEETFERAQHAEGAAAAKRTRAHLYLVLGAPARAHGHFTQLLATPVTTANAHRTALTQLGLAVAHFLQNNCASAVEAVAPAIPVFARYNDSASLAVAQWINGSALALQGTAAPAFAALQDALHAAQATDDTAGVTRVVHALEALAAAPVTDAATRTAAQTLAASVTTRRYEIPFVHPLIRAFNRFTLLLLASAIFLLPTLSVRSQRVAQFNTESTLHIAPFISPSANFSTNFTPVLSPLSVPRLAVFFNADIIATTTTSFFLVLIIYSVAYTVLGLLVVLVTPISQLQAGQKEDLTLTAEGIQRGTHALLPWDKIDSYVIAEYRVWHTLLSVYSSRAVQTRAATIEISAELPYYTQISATLDARLTKVTRRFNRSVNILRSPLGVWFTITLIYLFVFALFARYTPFVLTTNFLGPYSLADLYGYAPVGIIAPMLYWLILRPVRTRAFLDPTSNLPWMVGALGLTLLAIGLDPSLYANVVIQRPHIIMAITGLCIMAIAVFTFWQTSDYRGRDAYPVFVRYGLLLLLTLATALVARHSWREIGGYHYLMLGDDLREDATRQLQANADPAEISATLSAAHSAYDISLEFNTRDTDALSARGTVNAMLGTWEAAIEDYTDASASAPNNPALYVNRALAYIGEAQDLSATYTTTLPNSSRPITMLYQLAHDDFAQAALLSPHDYNLTTQQAALHLTLGELAQAEHEYDDAIALAPERGEAYLGLGWTLYYQAQNAATEAAQDSLLQEALTEFQAAAEQTPNNPSPAIFTGLGYTYYELGDLVQAQANFTHAVELTPESADLHTTQGTLYWISSTAFIEQGRTPCQRTDSDPAKEQAYRLLIVQALAEYNLSIQAAPRQAPLLFRRAQLHYLLSRCTGEDFKTHYEAAILDTSAAITLDATHPDWFVRRGNFYFGLHRESGRDAVSDLRAAIADYRLALDFPASLTDNATRASWYQTRGRFNYLLRAQPGTDFVATTYAAIDDFSNALALDQTQRGWYLIRAGLYYDLRSQPTEDAVVVLDAAIRDYYQALALSDTQDVHTQLSTAEIAMSRTHLARNAPLDAVTYARSAVANHATAPEPYLALGVALLAASDDSNATLAYETALGFINTLKDPDAQTALYALALTDLNSQRSARVQSAGNIRPIDELIRTVQRLQSP